MIDLLRGAAKDFLQNVYAPETFVWKLPAQYAGSMCLTFDDGPDPEFTQAVIEALQPHNIKATFFLIGERVKQYPEVARLIVDSGHSVSAHTYTHKELPLMTLAELERELTATRDVIREVTGRDCITYRPPRGRMNLETLRHSKRNGYKMIHWSRTYSDYLADGTDRLVSRMRSAPVQSRDVVLLHDNNACTVEALAVLAEEIRKTCDTTAVIDEQGNVRLSRLT